MQRYQGRCVLGMFEGKKTIQAILVEWSERGKVVVDEVMEYSDHVGPCQPLKILWGLYMRWGYIGEG